MNLEDQYIPQISLDCVIFGFHASQLKVLVLRFKNSDFFALPGGFIRQDEDLNEAAQRVLMERTGLTDVYLEQFYTFGQRERGEVRMQREWAEVNKRDVPQWLEKRFISVGFYALVDFSKVNLTMDAISDSCDWIDINELPVLMMDHTLMVAKALETLRLELNQKWLVFNLLPEIFTIAELQKVYETILGKTLLRTNFQRKILSLDILKRIEKKYTGKAHKAPYLYRFNKPENEDKFY